MTRISTAMISQNALRDLQKSQKTLFEVSNQTASQTKATDLKGYGAQTHTLISSQRLQANIQSRVDSAAELNTRLSMQDAMLGRADEVLGQLRDAILQDTSLNGPSTIDSKLEEAFQVIKDVFNLQLAGNYSFGGTRNDKPPIKVANLADLVANPIATAFEQGAQEQKVSVDGYQDISMAPVASEAALEVFTLLKDLAAGGPYPGPMSDAQKTALQAQLGALDDATQGMVQLQAENGRTQERVESAIERQQLQLNTLSSSIGNIVDVDLAEVAVKLNNAQTSYQASASVFNAVRGLTLLDVL